MITVPRRADRIPAVGHDEAMRLTATENDRLLAQLRGLTDEQWHAPTDCTGWSVRDVAVHLIASAQAQANPVEFARQVLAGDGSPSRSAGTGSTGSTRPSSARAPAGRPRNSRPCGDGTPARR